MNFLAHFELTIGDESPEFQLGGLLPDMAKRAGFQLTSHKITTEHENRFPDLVRGIRLHWLADKHFHQSILFETGNLLWKNALAEVGFPETQRKFFFYHLLFEMWLDRILIKQDVESPAFMYAQLGRVDLSRIEGFSNQVFGENQSQLLSVFRNFTERKFIAAYADASSFANMASGIFGHITHQQDTKKLINPILSALKVLDGNEDKIYRMWMEFRAGLLKI